MEPKKNPEVNLERKRGLFLQIGLVIALLVVLGAFEYKTYEKITYNLGALSLDDLEEEIIPITKQEVKPPPPPPPPPEIIEIVEDDVIIEDEIEIEDTESDEDEVIEIIEEDDEEIFMVVEQSPEFPCLKFGRKELCGFAGLTSYLQKNVKYPPMAIEYNIQGKVYIQFVVEKTGKVTNVKIVRSVDKNLDAEAVRVVKSFPNWYPGKQRGKSVRVMYTIPVSFTLN
jgi:protein TonB